MWQQYSRTNAVLTLTLTGVGPFGPSLTNMKNALKVLMAPSKIRYSSSWILGLFWNHNSTYLGPN